jgi:hypothetical protein
MIVKSQFRTFAAAIKSMPRACQGNFDTLRHASIEDCAYCAQHELDLYMKGGPNDIRNQKDLARLKDYFYRCTGREYRHQD